MGTFHSIILTAREFFDADRCILSVTNPITKQFLPSFEQEPDVNDVEPERLSELAKEMLDKDVLLLENLDIAYPGVWEDIKSLAAVALYTKQRTKPLGVLYIGYHQQREFSHEYLSHLTSFGIHSSAALQSIWLLWLYNEVARIGQEINEELETYQLLFDKLQARIKNIIDTDSLFRLSVYKQETNVLDTYMMDEGECKVENSGEFDVLCKYVMDNGESFISGDLGKDLQSLPAGVVKAESAEKVMPQSAIFVPLKLRDDSLGALYVLHPEPDAFDGSDLRVMELLGNQVALALNNVRLFTYLQLLDDTAQDLTQELNSEQLLQDVTDKIRNVTNADIVILFPYMQSEDTFQGIRRSGGLLRPDFKRPSHFSRDDVARLVIKRQEPLFAKDSNTLYKELGGVPGIRNGNFEEREAISSTAAVPLRLSNDSVGALFVNFRKPQRFDAAQKNLIRSLAGYAAIAIRNSREFEDLALRQVEELKLLQSIDEEIGRTLNINEVLKSILDGATKRVRAEAAAILLYNPGTRELETKVAIGRNAEQSIRQNIPINDEQGITVWAFNNRKPVRVNNVKTDPEWKDIYYPVSDGILSEMDVPLVAGNEAVGVINLESTRENAFSETDQQLAVTIAGQAVLAVKNAQTYERETQITQELMQITQELEALQEVGQEIVRQLETEEVLDTILKKALELTRSHTGEIMLCDKVRGDLYIAAERGVWPLKKADRQARDSGVIGLAIQQKKLFNVNVCEPPYDEIYIRYIPDVCLELAVPIMKNDEVIGVINIEGPTENPFTSSHEALITRLAVTASIALQNAEQFKEAKSSGEKLRALHEVSKRIISRQGSSEEVMKAILQYASQLTGAESGLLDLYSGGQPYKTYYFSKDDAGLHISLLDSTIERGIVALVARSHAPYRTPGDAQDDPNFKGHPDVHSEIAVPILTDSNELEGVLNLESPRHHAFNDEDVEVLQMFAQKAVIAIQYARNYSRAKKEAERFRLLWQASQELSKLTNLKDLDKAKDIAISKMAEFTEGEVVLRRYDESSQSLILERVERPRKVHPPQSIGKYEGVNGQVARELRTIVVRDTTNPEPGVSSPVVDDPDLHMLAVAPVLFEQRYYGNLVLSHDTIGYFEEADIKLLEGLAQQLAITIYRLKDAQERIDAEQRANELELVGELGQSAYRITHRIGNELGLVNRYVNKIRRELNRNDLEGDLIEKELQKILRDVGNVLNMSKKLKNKVPRLGPDGKIVSNRELYPGSSLIGNAKRALPPLPENIIIKWYVAEDLGVVYIDSDQVFDILYTLVSNSEEAMREGGEITIQASIEDRHLCIVVSDTGLGIPEANQPRIFDLFYSTKKSSGFGLWSARRYARANAGELTLESSSGRGATFRLRLPLVNR